MANIAREPLIIIQGLGVTVNPNNKTIFGKTSPSEQITISIGNNVSTTSNVLFNKLTPTNETFTINNFLIILPPIKQLYVNQIMNFNFFKQLK